MKRGRPQAKDITDATMLDVVRAARGKHCVPEWATLGDIQAALPAYPPKVVTTKLTSMVRRGVINGCACGCRGDFVIQAETEAKAPAPVADRLMANVVRRGVIVTFQDSTTAEARTFYGALILDARYADKFNLASRHRLPVTVVRQPRGSSDGAGSRSTTSERVEEESGSSPTPPAHPQPPTTSHVANATFLAASHDGAWYLPDGAALTFAAPTPTADDHADDHRGVPATAKADGGSDGTTFLLFKSAPTPTTHQGVTVGHNATATATTTTARRGSTNRAERG